MTSGQASWVRIWNIEKKANGNVSNLSNPKTILLQNNWNNETKTLIIAFSKPKCLVGCYIVKSLNWKQTEMPN